LPEKNNKIPEFYAIFPERPGQGQMFKAEAEAKAKASRPRPRPILWGRNFGDL